MQLQIYINVGNSLSNHLKHLKIPVIDKIFLHSYIHAITNIDIDT